MLQIGCAVGIGRMNCLAKCYEAVAGDRVIGKAVDSEDRKQPTSFQRLERQSTNARPLGCTDLAPFSTSPTTRGRDSHKSSWTQVQAGPLQVRCESQPDRFEGHERGQL